MSAALAAQVGRERSKDLVEQATRRAIAEDRQLRDVLGDMPEISERVTTAEIDRLLDPRNYLGSARRFVERVIGDDDATR